MAQLVSPGLSITVSDESQYAPAPAGTVALVVVASASNKTTPTGAIATATLPSNANKLLSIGSQRELVANFGYPSFKVEAGTPVHGYELNEYGLQAAYSALGLGNQMYVLRADINLEQLEATGIRPKGAVDDGFLWLDTSTTNFGIYEWSATTQDYTLKEPLVLSASTDLVPGNPVDMPKASVGVIGDYAVIVSDPNNPVFYKNSDNAWVGVGTTLWQQSLDTVQASIPVYSSAPVPDGSVVTINGTLITITATDGITATGADVVTSINTAFAGSFGDGIQAAINTNGRLVIRADSNAKGDGTTVDGRVVIGASDGADLLGLNTTNSDKVYFAPMIDFGAYTQVPTFATGEATPAPSGSVWFKTSQVGNGAYWNLKQYSSTSNAFIPVAAPVYSGNPDALFNLDKLNGGFGIGVNTLYVDYNTLSDYPATFRVRRRYKSGATKVTGAAPSSSVPFSIGDTFQLSVTEPGESAVTDYNFTITATDIDSFVALILSKGIPNVFATKEATGAISITHKAGGDLILTDTTSGSHNPIADAGITTNTAGVSIETSGTYAGSYVASNWLALADGSGYTASADTPYVAAADGTMWFFNDIVEADMLICDTDGWKGYRNVTNDSRGFDLSVTDTNGPIFSASKPVTQSTGNPLVKGDLWCDTGDLENYPSLYRYNGAQWKKIDNTDHISQNGIIFVDARWDASKDTDGNSIGGIVDPVTGDLPVISTMLTSNYVDLDCPDYRLYPRGTLLWNTRRNGGNIKQYISQAFTALNYPDAVDPIENPGLAHLKGTLPTYSASWVSCSGNQEDGSPYMLHKAQRHMVVKAMRAAIDSNTQIREEQWLFNLICCPGYYECLSNMTALNNDRANTAFIIGDTPMELLPNNIDITNWSNNVATTADVYTALYYPSALSNDLLGNDIVVPPSHIALRTFIHNDNISYPWFAPAGARRGLVDNATAVGYLDRATGLFHRIGVNHALRDSLYLQRINPIANLPGLGLLIFGNKTRSPIAQATDRVNVSRLVCYIRSLLAGVTNSFLFEPNDKITRDQIKQTIESAINDLVTKRGIYDYLVVCDSSNNTRDRIARNELYVDVAIEPMKDVEFIYIPVRLFNPGTLGA